MVRLPRRTRGGLMLALLLSIQMPLSTYQALATAQPATLKGQDLALLQENIDAEFAYIGADLSPVSSIIGKIESMVSSLPENLALVQDHLNDGRDIIGKEVLQNALEEAYAIADESAETTPALEDQLATCAESFLNGDFDVNVPRNDITRAGRPSQNVQVDNNGTNSQVNNNSTTVVVGNGSLPDNATFESVAIRDDDPRQLTVGQEDNQRKIVVEWDKNNSRGNIYTNSGDEMFLNQEGGIVTIGEEVVSDQAGLTVNRGNGSGAKLALKSNNANPATYLRFDTHSNANDKRRFKITNNFKRPGAFVADDDSFGVTEITFEDGFLALGTAAAGNDAPTEAMRIDSSQNVGIGTTSPSEKLDVSGNANISTDLDVGNDINVDNNALISNRAGIGTNSPSQAGLVVESKTSNDGNRLALKSNNSDNGKDTYLRFTPLGNGTDTARYQIVNNYSRPAGFVADDDSFGVTAISFDDGFLTFATAAANNNAPTEAMRIDSSQNVGIGTTSPSEKLDVDGNANISTDLDVGNDINVGNNALISNKVGIGTNSPDQAGLVVEKGDGSGTKLALKSNNANPATYLRFDTHSNANDKRRFKITNNFTRPGAFVADDDSFGVTEITFEDGFLALGTAAAGNDAPTEAMRIDSSQNVGINETDPSAPLDIQKTNGNGISALLSGSLKTSNVTNEASNLTLGSGNGFLRIEQGNDDATVPAIARFTDGSNATAFLSTVAKTQAADPGTSEAFLGVQNGQKLILGDYDVGNKQIANSVAEINNASGLVLKNALRLDAQQIVFNDSNDNSVGIVEGNGNNGVITRDASGDNAVRVGNGDNTIRLDTNNVERAIVHGSGRVGIGTSDPSQAGLVVEKGDGSGTKLALKSNNANPATYLRFDTHSNANDKRRFKITNNFTRPGAFVADDDSFGVTEITFEDGFLALGTAAAGNDEPNEAMRIDSSQNVGIGTDTINAPLEIGKTNGNGVSALLSGSLKTSEVTNERNVLDLGGLNGQLGINPADDDTGESLSEMKYTDSLNDTLRIGIIPRPAGSNNASGESFIAQGGTLVLGGYEGQVDKQNSIVNIVDRVAEISTANGLVAKKTFSTDSGVDANIGNNLSVGNDATISNNLSVTNDAAVSGELRSTSDFVVRNGIPFYDGATIGTKFMQMDASTNGFTDGNTTRTYRFELPSVPANVPGGFDLYYVAELFTGSFRLGGSSGADTYLMRVNFQDSNGTLLTTTLTTSANFDGGQIVRRYPCSLVHSINANSAAVDFVLQIENRSDDDLRFPTDLIIGKVSLVVAKGSPVSSSGEFPGSAF